MAWETFRGACEDLPGFADRYNTRRLHPASGYPCPARFADRWRCPRENIAARICPLAGAHCTDRVDIARRLTGESAGPWRARHSYRLFFVFPSKPIRLQGDERDLASVAFLLGASTTGRGVENQLERQREIRSRARTCTARIGPETLVHRGFGRQIGRWPPVRARFSTPIDKTILLLCERALSLLFRWCPPPCPGPCVSQVEAPASCGGTTP